MQKNRTPKELESLRRECEIQKDMRHPNIIQMLDSFETDNEIIVVTEYVEKVLHDILAKAGQLSEVRAQVVACDLVSALHYLHSKRILHRDMKPQNVLLDPNGVAKLCDFGFARCMNDTWVLMSVKGTPLYMAPELIEEIPYDHNVDLWSLGCICFELITGKPPFQTTSMRKLIELIRNEDIKWPENISANLTSFLQGLLQKDPSQRLTWPQLLDHPFVKGRILTIDEDAPRALTSPLSASQARAKQQQLQSLASRFTSQSKKLLEKQIKKIHSQVMRKSEASGSESSASVDVLLNNLSLRASLRSDLLAADYAICETDCPIADEDFNADQQHQIYKAAEAPPADNPLLVPPPACCLAALQAANPSLAAEWLLDHANAAAATAGAAACCLAGKNTCRSESCCCLSAANTSTSPSCLKNLLEEEDDEVLLDDVGESKQTTNASSIRLSSERHVDLDTNMAERQARLKNWTATDLEQPIENEEWMVFLQRSMEEMMDGEIDTLLQDNCVSVFVSTLKNPGASCRVHEYVACLLSLPFVLDCVTADDLERIQRVYLDARVVPSLVYAVKLLMAEKNHPTTDTSTSTANRSRFTCALTPDELQALESTVLILCRLVHAKKEFLGQFCDAVFLVADGLDMLQQLLKLERRRPRIVADLVAILSEVLRSETGNTDLVGQVLLRARSTDDLVDLFTKLMTHRQSKMRTRVCVLILLLGKFSRDTLQRIWGKSLRTLLENLVEDRDESVRSAATNATSSLKQLPFYNQEKDTWSVIDT
ncbi:serine/threonine-protein kinase fused-like [Copidosoma floridanum]|uniref:serine/threonine-protein kinase fused-like n=1 Tax=Copidosoma floridanum TaxID=29053 RepID=UPI0006C9B8F9|nr:serine/threonine-protein kinase fused-like [Copidosoma floridanum]